MLHFIANIAQKSSHPVSILSSFPKSNNIPNSFYFKKCKASQGIFAFGIYVCYFYLL